MTIPKTPGRPNTTDALRGAVRKRLRLLLKKRVITQSKISELTGIPQSHLSEFVSETGTRSITGAQLHSLVQHTEISADFLLGAKVPARRTEREPAGSLEVAMWKRLGDTLDASGPLLTALFADQASVRTSWEDGARTRWHEALTRLATIANRVVVSIDRGVYETRHWAQMADGERDLFRREAWRNAGQLSGLLATIEKNPTAAVRWSDERVGIAAKLALLGDIPADLKPVAIVLAESAPTASPIARIQRAAEAIAEDEFTETLNRPRQKKKGRSPSLRKRHG